jgi:hypothetical protein
MEPFFLDEKPFQQPLYPTKNLAQTWVKSHNPTRIIAPIKVIPIRGRAIASLCDRVRKR